MGDKSPKVIYACSDAAAAEKVKDRKDISIVFVKEPPRWLSVAPIIAIGDAQGRVVAGVKHAVTDPDVEIFLKALAVE